MLRFATIILLSTLGPAAANAAPDTGSRPQILSTERGISDGQRDATVLHTPPPSRAGAIATQPNAPAYDQQVNGSAPYPYIVAPYIQIPGNTPYPNPPRPVPHGR